MDKPLAGEILLSKEEFMDAAQTNFRNARDAYTKQKNKAQNVGSCKQKVDVLCLSVSVSISVSVYIFPCYFHYQPCTLRALFEPAPSLTRAFLCFDSFRFVSFRFVSFRFVSFRWMADHCTHTNTGDVAVRAGRLDGGGELRRRVSGEARALRPRPRGGERAEEGAGGGRVHGGGQGELPRLQGRLRRPES